MHPNALLDADLEVEMELVYEWVADAEDDVLADALEDTWFQRSDDLLAELDDAPAPERSLRGRVLRLIGLAS